MFTKSGIRRTFAGAAICWAAMAVSQPLGSTLGFAQTDQPALAAKPQIVAANKIDAVDDERRVAVLDARATQLGRPFFRISGATGEGLPALLEAMWRRLADPGVRGEARQGGQESAPEQPGSRPPAPTRS